jgi:hypothetical protein
MNLLVALHRWACDREQDENFTTEAFAHLLRHWLKLKPAAATRILNRVLKQDLKELDYDGLMIETQVPADQCRPDIELWKDGKIRAFIEAKIEQKVTWEQIQRHRTALKGDRSPFTALVLLTKVRVDRYHPKAKLVDRFIRWREVAEIVREELKRPDFDHKDRVSEYIAQQFIGFLKEEGLVMEKVEKAVLEKESISSFTNLMMMIEASVKTIAKPKHFLENGDSGFFFKRKSKRDGVYQYWCGIFHDNPGCIVFQIYEPKRVARNAALSKRWKRAVEGKRSKEVWRTTLPLDNAFFKMSADAQWEKVEEFFEKCLAALGEGPDQAG